MKKLFKTFAVLAAVAALGFSFVSCKNNDDDNGSGSPSSGGGNGGGGNSGYIGTKAPSEAKAVGDIVFNDGSATPYASISGNLLYSDYEKWKAIVAVIFYAGSSDDVLGAKTLGVGVKENQSISGVFAKSGTTGCTTNFAEIQCTPSASGDEFGAAGTATFTGDLDGSDNWAKICATDTTAEENAEANYSLFYNINNYGTKNELTGDYQSGWYLPTVAELSMLYRVKDTVNAAFSICGELNTCTKTYVSSSQVASDAERVWDVEFSKGRISYPYKGMSFYARAIRAF